MEIVRFIFGGLAAIAGAVGAARYIWATWSNQAKPEFWTWLIFGFGTTGAAIYTVEGHPGWSGAIFPVTAAFLIDIIFIHTWFPKFRYHQGDEEHKDEKLVGWPHKFVLVPAGVIAYGLLIGFHWPALVGALIGIAVDFSALVILALKSWKVPSTEDWPAYLCGAVGGGFGLIALQSWSFTTAAYPVYFAVTEAGIVYILLRKRLSRALVPRAAGA